MPETIAIPEQPLTRQQAARVLGCHPGTLKRRGLAQPGCRKVGGRYRYLPRKLAAHLRCSVEEVMAMAGPMEGETS